MATRLFWAAPSLTPVVWNHSLQNKRWHTDQWIKGQTISLSLSLYIYIYIYVMVWNSQRTGHRQRSQSRREITAGGGSNQDLLYSSRQFSAHPKSSLARVDRRAARAARNTRNTRYRYNQIGPLDHKMADNCVSLARTNTVFLYNN